MDTVVPLCMIIITVSLVLLVAGLIVALVDLRNLKAKTGHSMEKIEKDLYPLISNLETITSDLRIISSTVRSQVEKVDFTATTVNQNLNSVIEQWTRTATVLHDAIDDSVMDIASFIKGVSRGVKFFFNDGKSSGSR